MLTLARLFLITTMMFLFSCSHDDSNSISTDADIVHASTQQDEEKYVSKLDQVIRAGKVVIGSGYTVPPMNYIDSQGKHTGFDIDLGRAVVEKLSQAHGVELEIELVKVNAKTRIILLAVGRLDMAISSMSQTKSREEAIDFAFPPYLWVGKQFYAKKGRFKTLGDLVGKRIAVQQGSNAFIAGTQLLQAHGDESPHMLGFATDGEALLALKQDTVDAITQDNVILTGIMKEALKAYEPVGPIYSPGLYSIGVLPNDSKWRDAVSFALQKTMKDGTYEKIYQRWFGPEGKFPLATNARPRLPVDAYGEGKLMYLPD
ncbi:MAG: polar amino acid transport system substrate-binding protein [Candidatus Endobugula sp.]